MSEKKEYSVEEELLFHSFIAICKMLETAEKDLIISALGFAFNVRTRVYEAWKEKYPDDDMEKYVDEMIAKAGLGDD